MNRVCTRVKSDFSLLPNPHYPLPIPHSPLPITQSPVPSPQSPVPSLSYVTYLISVLTRENERW